MNKDFAEWWLRNLQPGMDKTKSNNGLHIWKECRIVAEAAWLAAVEAEKQKRMREGGMG